MPCPLLTVLRAPLFHRARAKDSPPAPRSFGEAMTASTLPRPRATEPLRVDLPLEAAPRPSRTDPVRFLQAYGLAVMLIPSTTVIGAIGAPGYPSSLIGMFAFAVLGASI